MDSYLHKWLQIQAYKHDGSFHRLWSHCYVVRDDEDYIVLCSNRVRVIESNNRKWHTRESASFICSKKHWFNVIATYRDDGVHYYVNVASPAIIDNGFIKYIDYDLDVKLFPNGFTKVLDVKEFNAHCSKYGYSDVLKKILSDTVDDVLELMKNKKEPFDEQLVLSYIETFKRENKTKQLLRFPKK